MSISAKADYAVRALLELAQRGEPATAEALAQAQQLPKGFTAVILNDLRRAGLLISRRRQGGYQLARPPDQITVGEVLRVVEGSLFEVNGYPPERITYLGAASHLQDVWLAAQASLEAVLSSFTLEQVAIGPVPGSDVRPVVHLDAQ